LANVSFPTLLLTPKVGKGKKKAIIDEGKSSEMDSVLDDDLVNMNDANAGIDQEQLTAEEKEEIITKSFNANNP